MNMIDSEVLARIVNQRLFGTSGIRGVFNVDLTPKLALEVGLALATHTNSGEIVIGHDTRVSSPLLEHSVISGLLSGGSNVRRLGLTPTPVLAFLTRELKVDAGLMITASHNPPEYNGIKIFNPDSTAYNEEEQRKIEEIIDKRLFKRSAWQNIKTAASQDRTQTYLEVVQQAAKLERSWRVVLDPGCGATCHVAPALFRLLECRITALNSQPDGFFPARSPAPEPESLEPLGRVVKELGADVGFAFDGDGDRVVVIDETGMIAPLDQTLAAYAGYLVRKHKGGVVVTTVETSMCLERTIEPLHGKVLRTRVGDVEVATAVKNRKAVFGGEPCGAWIHPSLHYCPDGILSSALLLKALEAEDKTVTSFISKVPRFSMLRRKLSCPKQVKSLVMNDLKKTLPALFPEIVEELAIDGVRLTLKNGWVLVRPSGTEPQIRITVEAENPEEARSIMEKSLKQVEKTIERAAK
ncbi:MAG: phosphoglucosamine mutase [Candidatus Bathyarchaeota archaeon]|nr:MAG: phosphoglucosamine mutase [Candidatus Bathyarchaeota archaeon]